MKQSDEVKQGTHTMLENVSDFQIVSTKMRAIWHRHIWDVTSMEVCGYSLAATSIQLHVSQIILLPFIATSGWKRFYYLFSSP